MGLGEELECGDHGCGVRLRSYMPVKSCTGARLGKATSMRPGSGRRDEGFQPLHALGPAADGAVAHDRVAVLVRCERVPVTREQRPAVALFEV